MTQSENDLPVSESEAAPAPLSAEGLPVSDVAATLPQGDTPPAGHQPRPGAAEPSVAADEDHSPAASDDDEDDDADEREGASDDEDEDDVPGPGQPGAKRAALENEGEIAADYLEELLDIADLDGDIDTFVEAGRARVSILTDGDLLVGRNGEVLEALQELARLAVMTETGKRSRLMLDVAGHREKRRRELQELAQDAVTEVQETKEAVRLAPMNPFERKIVHDVVASAGLVSESEGVEPQRRVVVLPA